MDEQYGKLTVLIPSDGKNDGKYIFRKKPDITYLGIYENENQAWMG